jgi:ribose 5-phosphate isomerase B
VRILIASDHAGVAERKLLVEHLRKGGHAVTDLGPETEASVDYPDFAAKVARGVAAGEADRGVLICGTGMGMAMAANKVHGIRAAVLHDEYGADMARRHNDANVACYGARTHCVHAMIRLTDRFLSAPFEGGRHVTRVQKIVALEGRTAAAR